MLTFLLASAGILGSAYARLGKKIDAYEEEGLRTATEADLRDRVLKATPVDPTTFIGPSGLVATDIGGLGVMIVTPEELTTLVMAEPDNPVWVGVLRGVLEAQDRRRTEAA
tara:strand:+ start:302 stop:634 length:333 start_codon:yes stop_codon:yes gene_type:complete